MNPKHFDLYTDYLSSSFGPVTATGLSRVLEGGLSHDQVTRLLNSAPKNSADLWKIVKPLVRAIEAPEGTLSIDDSVRARSRTPTKTISLPGTGATPLNVTSKGLNF